MNRDDAQRMDLLTPDHLPTCPRCRNVCEHDSRYCPDCGCYLLVPGLLEDGAAAAPRETGESGRDGT